jgi:hypothetical protein
VRITIDCDEKHLHAMRQALELLMRCGLGQFADIADLHYRPNEHNSKTWWGMREDVDHACRKILMPEQFQHYLGASYGIGKPEVHQDAKVCYEIWKLMGGGTEGKPLNYSGLPLPQVTIERDDK